MPNSCEFGSRGEEEEGEFDDFPAKDVEELKKDPQTCFFENQHHAHGSRWTPNYDRCFSCSCQVKGEEPAGPPGGGVRVLTVNSFAHRREPSSVIRSSVPS